MDFPFIKGSWKKKIYKNISRNCFQHLQYGIVLEHQIKILERFLKDYVTLKTGVIVAQNSALSIHGLFTRILIILHNITVFNIIFTVFYWPQTFGMGLYFGKTNHLYWACLGKGVFFFRKIWQPFNWHATVDLFFTLETQDNNHAI